MDVGDPASEPAEESMCFRECCRSLSVPLAAPKSEFASNLTSIHDGPASKVFLGRFGGTPVAVKRPKLPTKRDIDRYHVELRLMLELRHGNILPLVAAHARPPEYYLIFPYQENGSVAELIHDKGFKPNWCAILKLLDQVASALEFVHSKGYVHRDVKPSNVLLDKKWRAMLCDFGLAESETELKRSLQNQVYSEEDAEGKTVAGRLIAQSSTGSTTGTSTGGKPSGGFQKQHMVGTLPYMPPEVLMRKVPEYSSDVYAFAISACETSTQIQPYADRERNVALAHTVLDLSYNESDLAVAIASEGLRPSTPGEVLGLGLGKEYELHEIVKVDRVAVEGVSQLIKECWCLNPLDRPSFVGIRKAIQGIVTDVRQVATANAGDSYDWSPTWSPPSTSIADAGDASRVALEKLFAPGEWPGNSLRKGEPPKGWPSLENDATGIDSTFNPGVFSTCGARGADKMEDRHLVVTDVGGVSNISLAAAFDGHRGFECAEFSAQNFEQALVSVWHLHSDPKQALIATFESIDRAFVKKFEATKREGHSREFTKERFPGCTAICALKVGASLFVANAGDCRAVLCVEPDAVEALSNDHAADVNVEEQQRISTNVGTSALRNVNGSIRVGTTGLAVTRALGDFDCREFGVIPTPEVVVHKIKPQDTALVLACDGLWDVVSNSETWEMIRDTVKEPSMCAKRLGSEAITRNSGDNITVICVFLKETSLAETVTWERAFGKE